MARYNPLGLLTNEKVKRTDSRKQSLYLPGGMIEEAQSLANRMEKSLSFVFQTAFRLSKNELEKMVQEEEEKNNE